VPSQQLLDAIYRVIRNAGQYVPQVAFRSIPFSLPVPIRLYSVAALSPPTIGAREKKILSSQSHHPQRSFRRIIIDFDAAVITGVGGQVRTSDTTQSQFSSS
jgi:hypothetical protein